MKHICQKCGKKVPKRYAESHSKKCQEPKLQVKKIKGGTKS